MKWLMDLFKPKYTVCRECGVHFTSVYGDGEPYPYLCQAHRKEVKGAYYRKVNAMNWADENWVLVEKFMFEDSDKKARDRRGLSGLEGLGKRQYVGPLFSQQPEK